MLAGLNPLIIGAVGVALIIGIGVVWWINRTPGTGHHGPRVQPLFGSDVGDVGDDGSDAAQALPPLPRPALRPPTPPRIASPPSPAPAPRAIHAQAPLAPTSRSGTLRGAPAYADEEVDAGARDQVTRVHERVSAPRKAEEESPPRPRVSPGGRDTTPAASSSPPPYANSITAWTTTAASASVPGKLVEGHLVRFSVPNDGTLQFLPGRLEVSAGQDTGREIRFVRLSGPDGTVVTFGRSEGPLYRHVQLNDLTVSRAHARMRLADGYWHLTNLSQTNPVQHNGRVLGDDEEQRLEDGDRIEMGEVVFRFRSR